MVKYKVEKGGDTICGGSVEAIEAMILLGQNLNQIIDLDIQTDKKEEKLNLMKMVC